MCDINRSFKTIKKLGRDKIWCVQGSNISKDRWIWTFWSNTAATAWVQRQAAIFVVRAAVAEANMVKLSLTLSFNKLRVCGCHEAASHWPVAENLPSCWLDWKKAKDDFTCAYALDDLVIYTIKAWWRSCSRTLGLMTENSWDHVCELR